MKSHQERVVKELSNLAENLIKLDRFLDKTPSGIALDPEERADMMQQSDVMSTYKRILTRRVARF